MCVLGLPEGGGGGWGGGGEGLSAFGFAVGQISVGSNREKTRKDTRGGPAYVCGLVNDIVLHGNRTRKSWFQR